MTSIDIRIKVFMDIRRIKFLIKKMRMRVGQETYYYYRDLKLTPKEYHKLLAIYKKHKYD